jgi:phospholipid transport system substrate-binding protein
MFKRLLLTLAMMILFAAPSSANNPMDIIQTAVEKIVDLLKDPQYDPPEKKEEQREKIWNVVHDTFDFQTIARGTLRRHDWDSFSEEQKKEFTELFTTLLGNTYLERLQSDYREEKVVFMEQEMLSDTTAIVRTKIVREGLEIPVDYRLLLRGDTWRIYNVIVENISLVTNYRNQFSEMLMRNSPAQLIEKLKDRVNKSESES